MHFNQPYHSARSPVCADNLVATSQPLATAAGVAALRGGGNAVDAALAAAITLTVVEPNSNGVGGDAFAQVWDGERLHGLNASGRAPAAWSLAHFAGRQTMPRLGWDTVTVPGAVSAWAALSERFGKLPFAHLFEAAVGYARHGFSVSPIVAGHWAEAAQRYAQFPDFVAHFCPAPAAGGRALRPDLANSLEEIAATGGASFYRGALALRMAECAAAANGGLSLEDLQQHRADWVTPIAQPYRDVVLHELPPNGQGIAAQIALGILAHLQTPALDSAAAIHQQLEAMKIAIHAAFTHVADLDAMATPPRALLQAERLATLAAGIGAQAAPLPPAPVLANPGTVYLCAADAQGMMVSYIQSNYMGFGSGIVIPDTGIAMHNRGCGFVLEPEHPNCVGPGKRPFHTIIPGFVTRAGQGLMAFGVMGGHMQHQGHVQMMQRVIDHQQNPQAASDAPRWIVNPDFSVSVEAGFDAAVVAQLRERGHQVAVHTGPDLFGGAQLIYRHQGSYIGGSDHRKDGQVSGY